MARAGLSLVAVVLLTVLLSQCTNAPTLISIQVIPNAPMVSNKGDVIQFKAIGSYQRAGSHPILLKDITLQASWLSSNPGVATINGSGLATANSNGTTTICDHWRDRRDRDLGISPPANGSLADLSHNRSWETSNQLRGSIHAADGYRDLQHRAKNSRRHKSSPMAID
jgi:hypothetical protein